MRRCASADPDFWPAGVTAAVLGGSSDGAAAGAAAGAGDIWALLGLNASDEAAAASAAAGMAQPQLGTGAEAAAPARPEAAGGADSEFARAEAAQLLQFQALEDERAAQHAGGLAGLPAAASQQAQRGAQIVVVRPSALALRASACIRTLCR